METPITKYSLVEQQKSIVASLQLKVAGAIKHGVEYRRELESLNFAIDLLDRLSRINTEYYDDLSLHKVGGGY